MPGVQAERCCGCWCGGRLCAEKGEARPELLHLVKREQQQDGQRRLLQDQLPEQAPVRRPAEPGVAAGRMLLPRLEDDSAAIFDHRDLTPGADLQTERANFGRHGVAATARAGAGCWWRCCSDLMPYAARTDVRAAPGE